MNIRRGCFFRSYELCFGSKRGKPGGLATDWSIPGRIKYYVHMSSAYLGGQPLPTRGICQRIQGDGMSSWPLYSESITCTLAGRIWNIVESCTASMGYHGNIFCWGNFNQGTLPCKISSPLGCHCQLCSMHFTIPWYRPGGQPLEQADDMPYRLWFWTNSAAPILPCPHPALPPSCLPPSCLASILPCPHPALPLSCLAPILPCPHPALLLSCSFLSCIKPEQGSPATCNIATYMQWSIASLSGVLRPLSMQTGFTALVKRTLIWNTFRCDTHKRCVLLILYELILIVSCRTCQKHLVWT